MVKGYISRFITISLCMLCSAVVNSSEKPFNLMMTGSELQFCRSAVLSQCSPESVTLFSKETARKSNFYKLSMTQIEDAMSAHRWHSSSQVIRYEIDIFITEFAKKLGNELMSYQQLTDRWKSFTATHRAKQYSGHTLLLRLNKKEHDMVFDFLEVPQLNSFGQALQEQVNFLDNKYPSSLALAKVIVAKSALINGNSKPNVLLVTAGHRNTFVDIDAYIAYFNHLGATAQWLPIDQALNTLHVDGVDCSNLDSYREKFLNSYYRKAIYSDKARMQQEHCRSPSKISALINSADGIIFIGDSPKLLTDSLIIHGGIVSEPLKLIKKRVNNKKLFVTALGAVSRAMVGTQPNQPVIVSGSSHNALLVGTSKLGPNDFECHSAFDCQRKETLYTQGGIGLFDFAIIDTHFSREGRFARLANVAMATASRFSIGIDHDTAILVNSTAEQLVLKVTGLSGVTLIERDPAAVKSSTYQLKNLKLSYFTTGDTLRIANNEIKVEFPTWKPDVPSFLNKLEDYNNLLFGDNFHRFSQQACLVKATQWLGFAGRKKQFQISLEKSNDTQLKMGGLKIDDGFKLYCSYHALGFNLTRR